MSSTGEASGRAAAATVQVIPPTYILKLRATDEKKQEQPRRLTWSEDTVNNEKMGKKSSKRCCIYHKTKKFGESDSDESDSDVEEAAKQDNAPGKVKNYQRFHA